MSYPAQEVGRELPDLLSIQAAKIEEIFNHVCNGYLGLSFLNLIEVSSAIFLNLVAYCNLLVFLNTFEVFIV
jgi:hypothetical protein